MPFDPTKPADHSEILSAELRSQFIGLKDLDDEKLPAAEKGVTVSKGLITAIQQAS